MAAPLCISIVTPSLNGGDFIEKTIQSVLSQRGDFHLEYRVQDGESTDGTAEVLQAYRGCLAYRIEPYTGRANAINRGLLHAAGDVVGWLDAGDVLYPGALARVVEAFRSGPDVLWVHGRAEVVDANDRPIRPWVSAYNDYRSRRYSRRNLLVENFISAGMVFWRRPLLERVGLLDESLTQSFDYEYWLRLSALASPVYIPDRIGAVRHPTSAGWPLSRIRRREDVEAFRRHAPADLVLAARRHVRAAQAVTVHGVLTVLRA